MMHNTYELQTCVYGQCYKECYGKEIDNYGILWLKSSKRRLNVEKMTGKGWEVEGDKLIIEGSVEVNIEATIQKDRKSTRLNSSHSAKSRMPSSA